MHAKHAPHRDPARQTTGPDTDELRERIGERVLHHKGGAIPPPTRGAHPPVRSASDQAYDEPVGGAHGPAHPAHDKAQPSGHHPHGAPPPMAEAPQADDPATAAATDGPHLGDHGPQVAEVQQLLQAAGYYHGNIGGNFGPQTDAALRSFQRDHGLPEDGHAGAATLDALRATAPAVVPVAADAPDQPAATGAAAAISYGMSVLGAPYAAINPYRFGEVPWPGGAKVDIHDKLRGPYPAGTQVFDCSGFVVACWKHAGVNLLAHGLGDSWSIGHDKTWLLTVSENELAPGDMIVNPGHIVMYIGSGQVIQSTPNGGVKISDAGKYLPGVCRRVPV